MKFVKGRSVSKAVPIIKDNKEVGAKVLHLRLLQDCDIIDDNVVTDDYINGLVKNKQVKITYKSEYYKS